MTEPAPQELAFPDEPFRAEPPPAAPPRPFHPPPVRPFTLPGGIAAYLVEQHALPIVSLELSFEGGSAIDPAGKAGLAGLAMALLVEGSERLDKLAYAAALADVASSITAYAADDTQGVALASLRQHLEATFALLAETLTSPGLRAGDFERLRSRRIEAVRQARTSPSAIPGRALAPVLYGPDHPLGAVITEPSLAAVTLDDCRRQLATQLAAPRARLFAVGDLTEGELRALFERSGLGEALARRAPEPPAIPPLAPMPGRIFFVDVPGAAQSSVLRVAPGPTRTAPDYFANALLAAVLGGGFTSRINMNLREGRGVAYGARGGFTYGRTFGASTVSAQVQREATCEALLEIHREVEALHAGTAPVTHDELVREQTNAVRALPGRFATAQAALGQYRGLVYYGLPLDHFETYAERIAAVDEAQVARAAALHLGNGPARYLVVGDGAARVTLAGESPALREALELLAVRGDVGDGGLVELDVNGRELFL